MKFSEFSLDFGGTINGAKFLADGQSMVLRFFVPDTGIEPQPVGLSLLDLSTRQARNLDIGMPQIYAFDTHPHSNLIAATGNRGALLFNVDDSKILHRFATQFCSCIHFEPNGDYLLLAREVEAPSNPLKGVQIVAIDLEDNSIIEGPFGEMSVKSISVNPTHNMASVVSVIPDCWGPEVVTFHEWNEGHISANIEPFDEELSQLDDPEDLINNDCQKLTTAFSPNGDFHVSVSSVVRLHAFPSMMELVSFDREGQRVPFAFEDNGFDLEDEAAMKFYYGWSNPVFTSDSKFLFCASPSSAIFVWDLESLELIHRLDGFQEERTHLAIMPNDEALFAVTGSGKVRRFELS